MRIKFKHILFIISLLAFLGAISAYADFNQDLEEQLKELQALNKPSVVRAPAQPIQPVALPEPENSDEELVEEEILVAKAEKSAEKPKESELIKHADSVLAFMKEELMPSLESPKKSKEEERTIATEKRFNYAAVKYQNHRRSDREFKTAKQEEKLWQAKNGTRVYEPRKVVQSDGSQEMIWPEEPLFASVARARQARQFKESQAQQDQNMENLQRELNTYKMALTNPTLSQQNLDDIIGRYQDLFIKPNTTPATQETMPSEEEIWKPTLTSYKQSKQDTIIQSLQETLEELQSQGAHDRVKRILDEVVVAKLDQTANVSDPDSYPDPKSYKDTIKILDNIHNYKDPVDPSKDRNVPKDYYESQFRKIDTALRDKVQEVEKLLEESVLNALNEDFTGNLSSAVSQLNHVAEILKNKVLAEAVIRQVPRNKLVEWAVDPNKKHSFEERLTAIQSLVALMQDPTTGTRLGEKERQAILKFLNEEYPAYLTQKKEDCEKTGQTTLALDEGKINQLLDVVTSASDTITNSSTLSQSQRSLASQQLERVRKELLAKIEAKIDTELASGKLTKEQEELCMQGKASLEDCRVSSTESLSHIDATSVLEDTKASTETRDNLRE